MTIDDTTPVDDGAGAHDSATGSDLPPPTLASEPTGRLPGSAVAAVASIGAGAIHAGAIGIHAEHAALARVFVVMAVFQLGWGLVMLMRPSRPLAIAGVIGNGVAVAGWLVTRISGIGWMGGLETAEAPQFTDSVCAALGLVAAGTALVGLLVGPRSVPAPRLALPALAVAAMAVPAMFLGSSHVHAEGEAHAHGDGAAHGDDAAHNADGSHADGSSHSDDAAHHDDGSHVDTVAWPRPYDPTQPIDLSGVPGVTPDQEARATQLLATTQEVLPKFADVSTVAELGFRSIGDSGTGFEHFINYGYINDDRFLDPEYPESLVYQVDGDERTLVSAMFIARQMPIDDPQLVDYGGPLMQWHIHDNLCWTLDGNGQPKVAGVTAADGSCPPGSINTGGGNPMVHVWIAPHECGPFAALEGHGAGQVDPDSAARTDQCSHDHGDGHGDGHGETVAAKPYDPELPIDLSGMPGVTPQQQARAENLIAVTLLRLPQFADPAEAERRGFRSIRDGATGHEHYINWSYINDDKILDPDYPESLVYQPNPDGTKTLVSAMYMLPDGETLDTVPDVGGPLTQWHIHDNLCFSNDPSETGEAVVIGLTNAQGTCTRGVKLQENPMLHVWITPHQCGPFASLDGVGAGQIKEGEERLCDTAHGSH